MFNNVTDLVAWIEAQKRHSPKVSLEKMRRICEIYGNPQDNIKYIHIGGTNGKGSTVSFVKSILRNAGYNVGSYISPFVISFNERISYNDQFISDQDLLEIGNYILSRYHIIEERELEKPTFFEFVTLIAYIYFSRIKDLDFVTLEVGLGGRLDATNIVTPLISVITNVHYDHMNVLGDTIHEIAWNKLGIVKQNIPLVTLFNDKINDLIKETCLEKNSPLIFLNKQDIKNIDVTLEYTSFDLYDLKNLKTKMLGYHQAENASLAVVVTKKLRELYDINLTDENIYQGLWETFWPGRLQVVHINPTIILDGAHNIDGMTRLTEFLTHVKENQILKVVFAVSADKAKNEMISIIEPIADEIIFSKFNYKRSDKADSLAELSHHAHKRIEEDLDKIIAECLNETEKLIVFCGSLYFVSEVFKKF